MSRNPHAISMDDDLTLMEKWNVSTRLAPTYYWAAVRNAIAGVPGVLTVFFLAIVLQRRQGMLKQYQYTVVFITFGGYLLMLPVFLFNDVVAALLTYYNGEDNSFGTSVFACSLAKQVTQAIMNCNFSIGFIISLMRYAFLLHDIQMTWLRISIVSAVVVCPNLFYVVYIMFFGVIVENDCCERILEITEIVTPIFYYSYLMIMLIAAIILNIRTLLSLLTMKRAKLETVRLDKRRREERQRSNSRLDQNDADLEVA